PRQQRREPGPMLSAMELGITDHGQRPGREQASQIPIASFADVAKLFLAPARALLGHEPDPSREVPPRSESPGIADAGNQSRGQRRTDAWDFIKPLARLTGPVPSDVGGSRIAPYFFVTRKLRGRFRALPWPTYPR